MTEQTDARLILSKDEIASEVLGDVRRLWTCIIEELDIVEIASYQEPVLLGNGQSFSGRWLCRLRIRGLVVRWSCSPRLRFCFRSLRRLLLRRDERRFQTCFPDGQINFFD